MGHYVGWILDGCKYQFNARNTHRESKHHNSTAAVRVARGSFATRAPLIRQPHTRPTRPVEEHSRAQLYGHHEHCAHLVTAASSDSVVVSRGGREDGAGSWFQKILRSVGFWIFSVGFMSTAPVLNMAFQFLCNSCFMSTPRAHYSQQLSALLQLGQGMRLGIRVQHNRTESDRKMIASLFHRGVRFAAAGVVLCSAASGAHAFNVAFLAGRGHVLRRSSRGVDDSRVVAFPVRGQGAVGMSAEGGPAWRWGQATTSALAALQVCPCVCILELVYL